MRGIRNLALCSEAAEDGMEGEGGGYNFAGNPENRRNTAAECERLKTVS